ncbi:hypothetical protein CSPAE12_11855 [Colletotrichum incanum]|nr:hypothetical protein CSPAE12_11855 [Colletotrichum incanum]
MAQYTDLPATHLANGVYHDQHFEVG